MKNKYEIRDDIAVIFLNRRDGTIMETIIDALDVELLKNIKTTWYANKGTNGKFYTIANIYHPRHTGLKLHRIISNAPDKLDVDHINGNTLDNRRSNLRFADKAQNQQNREKPNSNNKSGVLGIYYSKRNKKWRAEISLDNKRIPLGYFKEKTDAENAVKLARARLMPYSQEAMRKI